MSALSGNRQLHGVECHLEQRTEAGGREAPLYSLGVLEGSANVTRADVDLEDAKKADPLGFGGRLGEDGEKPLLSVFRSHARWMLRST